MAVNLILEDGTTTWKRTGYPDVSVPTNNDYNTIFTRLITAGAIFDGSGCEDWTIEGINFAERIITNITENGIDLTPLDVFNFSFPIAGRNDPPVNPIFTFQCPYIFESSFRFFTPELNTQIYTAPVSETITFVNILGGVEGDFQFQVNAGATRTFAEIQGTLLNPADTVTITNNSTVFQDSQLKFEAQRAQITVSPFTTTNVFADNTISFGCVENDFTLSLSNKITVNSITTSVPADLYFALRTADYTVENYTLYPYANEASLQVAIDALTEGDKYSIHVFADWETIAGGQVYVEGVYQDSGIKKEFELAQDFESNPQFRNLEDAWKSDGITDYININRTLNDTNDITEYIFVDTKYSVSCWVKPLQTDFANYVFSIRTANAPGVFEPEVEMFFFFRCNTVLPSQVGSVFGYRTGGVNYNQAKNINTNLVINEWNHLLMTYDGTNWATTGADINIYVNGQLGLNINAEVYTPNGAELTMKGLGYLNFNIARRVADPNDTFYTAAEYADLMLCDKALTPAEIWQIYKRGTNVPSNYASHYPASVLSSRVLHYPLNAGTFTGLTVNDEVANSTANVIGQVSPDLTPIYY